MTKKVLAGLALVLCLGCSYASAVITHRYSTFEELWRHAVGRNVELVVGVDGEWRRVTETQMQDWLRTLPIDR